MKFERAAQVNARFAASAFPRTEILAALRDMDIEERQVTVLDRPLVVSYQAPVTPSLSTRFRGLFGGRAANAPAVVSEQDVQVMVHLGQDEQLAARIQELFRRSGAASVEYFAPTTTP